ncbi:putative cell survival pathways protein [Cryomyces antarcticus]|uniref:Cell survival pathways protein n=1 Tax=Cryomyces antarcticus TaxID=329879 RepID=A0ABR0LZL8_9PEZI|nr:putative cell survival pathways protein [Cryomyces antarcticus]KAK5019436.1 putative cell survival pathways protein [Cryomyces antarcticus]KAK5257334.1 putative cell survival pathways protein [Cryomyces antarcticus]
MMNWAKQQWVLFPPSLANVAGTQEPIYGPSAIQSVAQQARTTPYTELTNDDLRWAAMDSTSVETQTFYLMADSGHIGMAQVFYPDGKTPNLWSSDPLENYGFDQHKLNFHAQGCSVELSEDGSFYEIKSSTNKKSVVDLKVSRTAPGFVAGKNGTSFFGTDPQKPWGSMRHAFWPRCQVEGSILTQAGELDFSGRGFFVHALQGMKPHHAGATL